MNKTADLERESKQKDKEKGLANKCLEAMAKLVAKKGDASKLFKGDMLAVLFVKCGAVEDADNSKMRSRAS